MRKWLLMFGLLFVASIVGAQTLTNGGFESCTNSFNWAGSGWNNWGECWNDSWPVHSGSRGMYFPGWNGPNSGGIWQSVPLTTTGTYTLSAWTLEEVGFNPLQFELKLEFYAADNATKVQADQINDIVYLPEDGFWHLSYLTVEVTNPSIAYIRAVIYCNYAGPNPGGTACFVDDIQLYSGSFTGSVELLNPSFENGPGATWRGTQWAAVTEDHWRPEGWAGRSGSKGVALEGWHWTTEEVVTNPGPVVVTNIIINAPTNIVNKFAQPLVLVNTGTYTYSVWMSREPEFKMDAAEVRIEYYDFTCSTKVQSDTVTNLIVPNDNTWREYYVVGQVTNMGVYEVRPVVQVTWDRTTNSGAKAARIDDARWRAGTHDGYSVKTDWGYHAGVGYRQYAEVVPGSSRTFAEFNYNTHTNTLFILGENPTVAKYSSLGDVQEVGVRIAYQRPENSIWEERYYSASVAWTQVFTTTSTFHGKPTTAASTVNVWQVSFQQPTNIAGGWYTTNSVRVFYAPYYQAKNGIINYDWKYLVRVDGDMTNPLSQPFSFTPINRDYYYDNFKPPTLSAFTNGGFENPIPATNNLDNTGWTGYGGGSRETWAAHSGTWGGFFPSWDPGAAGVYQDVATTGGTYELSMFTQIQPGANPTLYQLKMEWYNKNGSLVQENIQDLLALKLHKLNNWTKVCVVGSCYDTNLDYVRCAILANYNDGTNTFNEGIAFDDVELNMNVRTTLQNGGFEIGMDGGDAPEWYMAPGYLGLIHNWSGRLPAPASTNGFAFHGWETQFTNYEAMLYQPIATGTGTYEFALWILRQANFNIVNAELQLKWFDASYTNKVQADTVLAINPPNDGAWYQYAVTGTCNNASVKFVQPTLYVYWTPNASDPRALMIDDITLTSTTPSGDDLDGDGMADWWENLYLGGTGTLGADDTDGDGSPNIDEWLAYTHPSNNASFFKVNNATGVVNGALVINPTGTGRVYEVYFKTNLIQPTPDWQHYGVIVTGNGAAVSVPVTNNLGTDNYRIHVHYP